MKNTLSYLAGYIDGDGCFFLRKQESVNKYRAEIVISSTNEEVLQSFKEVFGGSVYLQTKRFDHWKRTYHWLIRGVYALEFSKNVVDILIEKKGDCLIFMDYIQQKSKTIKQELINTMRKHREISREVNESVVEDLRKIRPKGFSEELDFPYLAGFIDAECCLCIQKDKPKNRPNATYKVALRCNNTNPTIFYWLMQRLGGSITHIKRREKNPKHRDQISWIVTGPRLVAILPKLLPYLRTKKPVCAKLIEFQNTFLPNGGDRQSEEFKDSYEAILAIRERIVEEVHKLNSKGVNNV